MKLPRISDRASSIPVSAVRQLSGFQAQVIARGTKIYHLNIGDPDVKTPQIMLDALHHWQRDPISYTNSKGTSEFLRAMAQYYHNLGYSFVKEEDIVTTVGGSEAILMAFLAIANPGDEVLVFEPFYSNYGAIAHLAGVKLVGVETDIAKSFHLPDSDQIEAKITPRTKGVLFCSPGNPTGTVYSDAELKQLLEVAKRHNLFLLSDEVYREYVFDGREHASLFSYMEADPERIIVLDSVSKRYSLCGARVGTLTTRNEAVRAAVIKMAQARLSGDMLGQTVAAEMTHVPASYLEDVRTEYQKRRDVLYEGLMNIPGVTTYKPEGAFYTMVSLPVDDGLRFATWLLTEFEDNGETVMLAPGSGFYSQPSDEQKREVRIAYVLNEDALRRSLAILKVALAAYPHAIA